MADRVAKLAKRDTTGAYVIRALMKHLKEKYVKSILDAVVPEMNILLNSSIDFGSAIVNASEKENNYLRQEIITQLLKKYYNVETENKDILESCLLLKSSTLGNTKDDWPTAEERRRSIFLEQLIDYDDKFLNATIESMLTLPGEELLQMCYHGVFSHVVEHVLNPKRIDIIKRKMLLNILWKDIVNLSCNAYGSHVVDKLWDFTAKLTLYKERIATTLVGESDKVKNSTYGRQVWKNWKMELFVRKRWDWKKLVKEHDLETFPDSTSSQLTISHKKHHEHHNESSRDHKRLKRIK